MSALPALIARATNLLSAGRAAEAILPLREAVSLDPANPVLLHDLGLACLQAGELADAVAALDRAVTLRPAYADAWFRLGIAQERQDNAAAAIHAYHQATHLQPRSTEAWFRAGSLVLTLGHRAEAVACFRRAAAVGAKTAFGRLAAARALLADGRDAEAERLLRRMLALHPAHAMAQDLLANLLADAGRFQEARFWFECAVADETLMAGSYYDLVRCQKLTAADAGLVPRMKKALALADLPTEHRARLHLALGKAADDFDDPAAAMHHFDAADALRTTSFDAEGFAGEIARLIGQFTPALIATASAGNPDPRPILIIGLPRSGTTLIEQIISSHPDVTGGGELNFWNEHGLAWRQSGAAPEPAFLRATATAYLASLRAIGATPRVTDKMPFNFAWAGLIHLALPQAIIVHVRRRLIDTALSIHQTHFNPRVALPTGGEALVHYMRGYQRLMAHWRLVLPSDRFIEADYEQLTRAPEPGIRRLIAACGLQWNDACLQPHRNPRLVKTPSRWQARQPIHAGATDRWRRYEPYLGPLRALAEDDEG